MAQMTFETAMKQIEQIVQELEAGDLPLEKALRKFENGVKLSKFCSEKLDEAENRVSLLVRDQKGDVLEKPFDPESE